MHQVHPIDDQAKDALSTHPQRASVQGVFHCTLEEYTFLKGKRPHLLRSLDQNQFPVEGHATYNTILLRNINTGYHEPTEVGAGVSEGY